MVKLTTQPQQSRTLALFILLLSLTQGTTLSAPDLPPCIATLPKALDSLKEKGLNYKRRTHFYVATLYHVTFGEIQ